MRESARNSMISGKGTGVATRLVSGALGGSTRFLHQSMCAVLPPLCVVLAGVILLPGIVVAQGVTFRMVEDTPGSVVYELTASWPMSLRAALDSVGAVQLDNLTAMSVSRGSMFARSATLHLPALALPRLRIVAADYDEVHLPPGKDSTIVDELGRGPVEVVGLGLERKRPAATLVARFLTYNSETGTLRRYRRLTIAAEYASGPAAAKRSGQTYASESVLADGTVFKIAVRTEGIVAIDRSFLSSLPEWDIALDNLDPEDVQVYGNGGAPLPALNSAPRPDDLVENQVFVRGGGDGSFDEGDAIWFYTASPTGWRSVIQRDRRGVPLTDEQGDIIRHWEHYVHPFSNDNYFFIKIGGVSSDQIEQEAYVATPGAIPVTQITGRHFVDLDEFLWSQESPTGHTWVSNVIGDVNAPRTIFDNTSLPGLLDGTVTYRARAAIQSNPAASASFTSGSEILATVSFGPVNNSPTNTIARSGIVDFEQVVSRAQPINLSFELQSQIGGPEAAVDWVRVFYPRGLHADGGPVRFHTPIGETGTFDMRLTGFGSPPMVWDITDPGNYRWLGVQAVGSDYSVHVTVQSKDAPRELIAFLAADVQVPDVCPPDQGCRVPNQNLHGIQSMPDFVIVTPALLQAQAEELAEMRRQEGLIVEVVDVREIFNEFSGGLVDVRGIRDYLRFLYDRASREEEMLQYVLFLGDGHFNYRNLGAQEPEFPNLIPPFETEESWNPELSYTTDDYFGLLDANEGVWPYTRETFVGQNAHLNERVDLGIGRITVHTPEEAQVVLDKIKHYESPDTYGAWRNRYLFVADDGPTGSAATQDDRDLHTQNTDVVAEIVGTGAPQVDQKKVYGISYQREFRNAWRLPGARQDIFSLIREGVLVVNFSGHGSDTGLAQEDLFNIDDARNLQNRDKLPIFITATCSFGRWDSADSQSGAEELLLNPDGGAIALLTTVRSVYTSGNAGSLNVGLNVALNAELFQPDEEGLPRRLGDVLRLTKNTRVGYEGNNRKFNLLGDPTMRVGIPARDVVVHTVNEKPVDSQSAVLQALGRVTVMGEVRLPDGTVDNTFTGQVSMTVFDVERRVAIPSNIHRYMPRPYYVVREDLIWRGRIKATDGRFQATFVVPKDISYSNSPGRISLYAHSASVHAQGYTENVIVGGTATELPDDDEGPEIDIFLDDETFVSGGLTSSAPRVLAKLFDESGVNTVGAGIGHEMLLVLDDDAQNAVNVSDLYESEENSFQRGRVVYTFEEELNPGPHTLKMRAWDVLNNSGSSTLDFVVANAEALVIRNVFNYPNPTTGPTRFVFEHNQRPGTPVRVQVRIYSLSGRPVRTVEEEGILPGGPMHIIWDGMDDDFSRLSPGIYLYKVRVEVDGFDGERQVSEVIERLAVIR